MGNITSKSTGKKPQKISKAEWRYAASCVTGNNAAKIRRKNHLPLNHSFLYIHGKLYALDCHAFIAKGGFGKVKFAQDKQGHIYVIKKLNERGRNLISEMQCLEHMGLFEAAMQLRKISADDQTLLSERRYIIMKYIRGQTLNDYLDSNLLSDKQIQKIAFAITKAVANMHQNGVVHGDLKPNNIIIYKKRGQYQAKIIDFGGSQVLPEGKNYIKVNEIHFSEMYVDPYLIVGDHQFKYRLSKTNDLYSLAQILVADLGIYSPVIDEVLNNPPHDRPRVHRFYQRLKSEEIEHIPFPGSASMLTWLYDDSSSSEDELFSLYPSIHLGKLRPACC